MGTRNDNAQAKTTFEAHGPSSNFLPDDVHICRDDHVNGTHNVARSSSLSVSGKSANRVPINRGASDPDHTRPHDLGAKGDNSAGHAYEMAGERQNTGEQIGLDLGVTEVDS